MRAGRFMAVAGCIYRRRVSHNCQAPQFVILSNEVFVPCNTECREMGLKLVCFPWRVQF